MVVKNVFDTKILYTGRAPVHKNFTLAHYHACVLLGKFKYLFEVHAYLYIAFTTLRPTPKQIWSLQISTAVETCSAM